MTNGGIIASTDDLIRTQPLSIIKTTNKFCLAVNFDDESHYFAIPRKHNHSATDHISNNNFSGQIMLVSDPINCQKNITTHVTHNKTPQSGRYYLF